MLPLPPVKLVSQIWKPDIGDAAAVKVAELTAAELVAVPDEAIVDAGPNKTAARV